jgi:branched-chain amino acid transport system permease protein
VSVSLDLLLQQLANGLSVGMGYALMALGLTLVFGVLHIINFAHGEFFMLGALAAVILVRQFGLPYETALVLVPCLLGVAGWLVERIAVGNILSRKDGFSDVLLSTYAVGLLAFDAVLAARGPAPERADGFAGSVEIGPVILSNQRLATFLVGLLLIVVLDVALRRSRFGRQLRAVAQNRFAAFVVGVNVAAIGRRTFMLGAAIAGLAGTLLVPIMQFTPAMGQNIVIKAFVVVVVGGMGNVTGAVVCGIALGVVEALVSLRLSDGFTTALVYALLLVTLLVRPSGLFGRAH